MILSNQVRCHKCGDTPFSAHRHDYRPCKCGSIAVDGGMAYLRRVGDISAYDDMSIDLPEEACRLAMQTIEECLEKETSDSEIVVQTLNTLVNNGVSLSRKDTDYSSHLAMLEAANAGVVWGRENGRNSLGILCAIARNVRDADGIWRSQVDA